MTAVIAGVTVYVYKSYAATNMVAARQLIDPVLAKHCRPTLSQPYK